MAIQDTTQNIDDLIKKYTTLSKEAAKDIANYEDKLKTIATKKFEDQKKAANERISKLEEQGIFLIETERARLHEKYQQAALQEKLDDELNILKQVSEANKKERDAENKLLQLKVNTQRLINAAEGKTGDELKKAQKEISDARLAVITEEKEQLKKRKELNKQEKHNKANVKEAQLEKKQQRQDERERQQKDGDAYGFGDKFFDAFSEFRKEINQGFRATVKSTLEEDLLKGIKAVGDSIKKGLDEINNSISSYAKYQTTINSRLQGVSSFSEAVDTLSEVAFSPLLKAEDLYSNLGQLVHEGIVTNVEQRAFFQTIKDGIAETFDVNSASLRRLIRIQQQDSTAARLGMEGYLNKFLNTFVENTEYLTSTFDNVADALLEASALMSTQDSTEFEYVVQKWLGTLSGVGLSDTSAQNIADAIGKVGAGDIDVLNSEAGVLLTMSAARIGKSIGDMLSGGLNADETNELLRSMVEYLHEISDSSNDNNVVKSQLAKIFGVSISDLTAVGNLMKEDISQAYGAGLNYAGMYTELTDQFKELKNRMGIANILENLFGNLTYQTGMNIASNPMQFATWKITDLIGKATGGINIPFVTALGSGVDLETTVDNLMKIGIVGVSTISQIGDIVNGLSSIGNPVTLLDKLKVTPGMTAVTRGEGYSKIVGGKRTSGVSQSEVTYIASTNADAYKKSALTAAYSEAQQELDAKLSSYEDPLIEYLDKTVQLKKQLEIISASKNNQVTAYNTSTNQESQVSTYASSAYNNEIISDIQNYSSVAEDNNYISSATKHSSAALQSNAGKYLENMQFDEGFQQLVNTVTAISEKINVSGKIAGAASQGYADNNTGIGSGITSNSGQSYQSGASLIIGGVAAPTL